MVAISGFVGAVHVGVAVGVSVFQIRSIGATLAERADYLRMGHTHMFQRYHVFHLTDDGRRCFVCCVGHSRIVDERARGGKRQGREEEELHDCCARQRAFSRVWRWVALALWGSCWLSGS